MVKFKYCKTVRGGIPRRMQTIAVYVFKSKHCKWCSYGVTWLCNMRLLSHRIFYDFTDCVNWAGTEFSEILQGTDIQLIVNFTLTNLKHSLNTNKQVFFCFYLLEEPDKHRFSTKGWNDSQFRLSWNSKYLVLSLRRVCWFEVESTMELASVKVSSCRVKSLLIPSFYYV